MLAQLWPLGLLLLLAAGGTDEPPGRMPPAPPDRLPPSPDRAPPPADAPITMQMLAAPAPVPSSPSPAWQRRVWTVAEAVRSKTQDGTGLPIPPLTREDLGTLGDAAQYIVARLWLESEYNPVIKERRAAAAMWSWAGRITPGARPEPIVKAIALPSGTPRMDWITAWLEIDVANRLELFVVYPGRSHTGDERGRKYVAVFEWRVMSTPPAGTA